MYYLTGPALRRLMRQQHVTIRQLSARMQITLKRIRLCQREGIQDACVARDWIEAITGHDPGRIVQTYDVLTRRKEVL
jgi:hypothetical protein